MKILITGEKSYVGTKLKKWLYQWSDKYIVDLISLKKGEWKNKDFSQYDVLFHVAALVHQKERPKMQGAYFKVNKDLTIEVAKKAKQSGIKQFIFMSSMSVYGLVGKINENVVITKDTVCQPNTFYGKSKLAAEKELEKLKDANFRIAIIRAPMIFGLDCPGNYTRLKKLVMKVPIFPSINNKRSMIYIDNLTEFIRLIIDNLGYGLFFPQNKEYTNTYELVQLIAKGHSRKVYFSKALAFLVTFLGKRISIFNKVFGNLVYDLALSAYKDFVYCVTDLDKAIEACKKNKGDLL